MYTAITVSSALHDLVLCLCFDVCQQRVECWSDNVAKQSHPFLPAALVISEISGTGARHAHKHNKREGSVSN